MRLRQPAQHRLAARGRRFGAGALALGVALGERVALDRRRIDLGPGHEFARRDPARPGHVEHAAPLGGALARGL